jgi:CRP-like cAMP-binding protein
MLDRALANISQYFSIERLLIQLGLDPGNITYDAVFNRLTELLLASITFSNVFALVGGIFLIATFVVRTIVPMRVLTIVSIVFFLGSAALAGSVPRFFLYLLALPINVIRLVQIRNLVKKARSSAQGTMSLDWLRPYMTPRTYHKGDVLFRKGDPAAEMFLTESGTFLVTEINIEIPPGRILGELGFLSPDNHRTQSVECTADGEALAISYDKLLEIYFENPEFGYFFLRLTSDRLLQNFARLEALAEQNRLALAARAAKEAHPQGVPDPAADAEKRAEQAARRRKRALAIVERHANFSAVSGFIPLPIVNVAAVAAVMVRMVQALSRLYGLPFERHRATMLLIGLTGGVMPTGLASAVTTTLITAVPGPNLMGLAISSVTASACARRIGRLVIDHFEAGASLQHDFTLKRVRRWRRNSWLRLTRSDREWSRAVFGP